VAFKKFKLYLAGIGFWFFASLISITYYPLISLLPISSKRKRDLAQDSNAFFFGFYIKVLIFLKLITVKIEGLQYLSKNQTCIFIANHPSMLDVFILMEILPRVTCVIKASTFHHKVLATGIKMAGYLSNENPLEFIEKAQNRLHEGARILIFPEGTRSKPGEPLRFARGAASLSMLTSCKIIPIFKSSEPRVMFRDNNWRNLKNFPIEYKVILKDPILPEQFKNHKKPTSQLNKKLEELYQIN
jgi:1-acyl-sn-glycerol-3-phosphate acyltransferase